jgi:hypothetical protein
MRVLVTDGCGFETFEKTTLGHYEAHERRGNLFNNQCIMRLLRRPQASSQCQIRRCERVR